jgi:hypothetical protein
MPMATQAVLVWSGADMNIITNAASSLLKMSLSEAGREKLGQAVNVASHIAGRVGLQLGDALMSQHTAAPGDPKNGMFLSVMKALQGLEAVRNVHVHERGGTFDLARAAFGASKVTYERDLKMPTIMSFLGISDHAGNLMHSIGQTLAAAAEVAPQVSKEIAAQAREAFFSRGQLGRGQLGSAFRAAFQEGRQASRAAGAQPAAAQPRATPSAGFSTFANQPWMHSEAPPPRRTSAPDPRPPSADEPAADRPAPPPRPPKAEQDIPSPDAAAAADKVEDAPPAKPPVKPLYAYLELPQDATHAEIRKAYKQQALKHHPDKNGGSLESAERFRNIQTSLEILSDAEKRAQYDQGLIDEKGDPVPPPVNPQEGQAKGTGL